MTHYIIMDSLLRDPEHPFVFGSVLFMGTWISMMIACVNGSGIPILVITFAKLLLIFF